MRARLRRRALSTGVARVKALRPTASADVGGAAVLQRCGPWQSDRDGSETAWHRFCCYSAGAAASAPPSTSGSEERELAGVERAALAVAS